MLDRVKKSRSILVVIQSNDFTFKNAVVLVYFALYLITYSFVTFIIFLIIIFHV